VTSLGSGLMGRFRVQSSGFRLYEDVHLGFRVVDLGWTSALNLQP
jgi:hypothetical protein